MLFHRLPIQLVSLTAIVLGGHLLQARAEPAPSAPLDELRDTFSLHGKPVPPLLFRDMGEGSLADLTPILVSADVKAAIGSNRYGGPITQRQGWTSQADAPAADGSVATFDYKYVGTTAANLIVVETRWSSSSGSGVFTTLHVFDATLSSAFDDRNRRYERVDLTTVQIYPLGDRWSGDVTLSGNVATIRTFDAVLKTPAEARSAPKTLIITRP